MAVSKTFRLPDDLVEKLQAAADAAGTSLSAHVVAVLAGDQAHTSTPGAAPIGDRKPTLAEARAMHAMALGMSVSELERRTRPTPLAELHADGRFARQPKPANPTTPAEARAILEAAGLHVHTAAELAKLTQPAEGRAHTGPAFERPAPTRANTPGRKPPKGAILPPDERQPGMSKNAVVRKTLKKRRLVGFDAAGGEVWK